MNVSDETWRMATSVVMWLTAIAVITFVFNYFLRFPWYKNQGGWNLLLFMAVIGEFLLLSLYARKTGKQFPELFKFASWMQIMPLAWWRLGILVWVEIKQRRKRRGQSIEEKAKPEEPIDHARQ